VWKDRILPLVSMYVPVHPADRKKFRLEVKAQVRGGLAMRASYWHFRGAGREPRDENFGAT